MALWKDTTALFIEEIYALHDGTKKHSTKTQVEQELLHQAHYRLNRLFTVYQKYQQNLRASHMDLLEYSRNETGDSGQKQRFIILQKL